MWLFWPHITKSAPPIGRHPTMCSRAEQRRFQLGLLFLDVTASKDEKTAGVGRRSLGREALQGVTTSTVNMCSTDGNVSLSLQGKTSRTLSCIGGRCGGKSQVLQDTLKLPAGDLHDAEHAGRAHARLVHCYSTLQACDALLAAADAHGGHLGLAKELGHLLVR